MFNRLQAFYDKISQGLNVFCRNNLVPGWHAKISIAVGDALDQVFFFVSMLPFPVNKGIYFFTMARSAFFGIDFLRISRYVLNLLNFFELQEGQRQYHGNQQHR